MEHTPQERITHQYQELEIERVLGRLEPWIQKSVVV